MPRCTKHVLSKDVCHANQLLPWIAQRGGMSYEWGMHQYIFEKFNMFNSFLSLKNLFSLSTQNFRPVPRTLVASQKGLLDGAVDSPSFIAGVVDPTHSSRDVLVNLTL